MLSEPRTSGQAMYWNSIFHGCVQEWTVDGGFLQVPPPLLYSRMYESGNGQGTGFASKRYIELSFESPAKPLQTRSKFSSKSHSAANKREGMLGYEDRIKCYICTIGKNPYISTLCLCSTNRLPIVCVSFIQKLHREKLCDATFTD